MAKLIAQTVISVDGYFEGANSTISWHHIDNDYNNYAASLLQKAEMILFGRVTYQLMEAYWPSAQAYQESAAIAKPINALKKMVFSRTLTDSKWPNTLIERRDAVEVVNHLKEQMDGHLVILGSGMLIQELTKHRLIDEYQLMVTPIILGEGRSTFPTMAQSLSLSLIETKRFSSGNVLLRYQSNEKC
ncbi:dihydrofolate reductase family protein [Amphibacillus sediminis]|uniref:dihydrofolate reductase family protein n=1 Tax=Amphibacillus sediminis TaxID=360185 RepID=UPI00082CE473|nr:dihydrofolate reductase family protein [Amphibacillus sediminis]